MTFYPPWNIPQGIHLYHLMMVTSNRQRLRKSSKHRRPQGGIVYFISRGRGSYGYRRHSLS